MVAITAAAKRLKVVHSAYKFARDRRQVPTERWRRPHELLSVFRVLPNTMLAMGRLFDAYEAVQTINAEGIIGDVVECGVWNGGCVGVMALAHQKTGNGISRRFHLFDSFEGLPPPSPEDGEQADWFKQGGADRPLNEGDPSQLVAYGACAGDNQPAVEQFLTKTLGIEPAWLRFHVGWFQNTVPAASDVGPIAILRLDGDWYDSTRVCIEQLYDRVTEGGFVIIDDYGTFAGCKRAIDEFMHARNLRVEMRRTDSDCIYFRKPYAST